MPNILLFFFIIFLACYQHNKIENASLALCCSPDWLFLIRIWAVSLAGYSTVSSLEQMSLIQFLIQCLYEHKPSMEYWNLSPSWFFFPLRIYGFWYHLLHPNCALSSTEIKLDRTNTMLFIHGWNRKAHCWLTYIYGNLLKQHNCNTDICKCLLSLNYGQPIYHPQITRWTLSCPKILLYVLSCLKWWL